MNSDTVVDHMGGLYFRGVGELFIPFLRSLKLFIYNIF